MKIISRNADTVFGHQCSFSEIDSVEAFQKCVPLQTHEDVNVFIDRIALGEQNVLTSDPIRRFGATSGSTKAVKLIPYNDSLVSEFQEGVDVWVCRLMSANPKVVSGTSYWSVTPVGEEKRITTGGIPVGFDDERAYFGKLTRWVLDTIMVVPSELAQVKEMDAFRYATLRFLIAEKSLTWISVWNPTFLCLLLAPLEGWFERLIHDVRHGTLSVELGVSSEIRKKIDDRLTCSQRRANELAKIRDRYASSEGGQIGGKTIAEAIWPKLSLISCWADGNARDSLVHVQKLFPNITIEPKGLVATEAFVSFPFSAGGSALSLTSHFFEFEEVRERHIFLAHELRVGCHYAVIVTTSGGLYRYRLNDVIEVLGHSAECPIIRFIGRQEKVVDLVGEKLNEQFATESAREVFQELGFLSSFWMFAPNEEVHGAGYTLYLQSSNNVCTPSTVVADLAKMTEYRLCQSYHYEYARRLGQLAQLRLFKIASDCDAQQVYLKTCANLGQRLGDIKPTTLHFYKDWAKHFDGSYVT